MDSSAAGVLVGTASEGAVATAWEVRCVFWPNLSWIMRIVLQEGWIWDVSVVWRE